MRPGAGYRRGPMVPVGGGFLDLPILFARFFFAAGFFFARSTAFLTAFFSAFFAAFFLAIQQM